MVCWYFHNHYINRGEWSIIRDECYLYIANNTDFHQALILSPFEQGFMFFPTDKNAITINNIISYPNAQVW